MTDELREAVARDITESLRNLAVSLEADFGTIIAGTLKRAADEIEQLRAQIESLQDAMQYEMTTSEDY